MRLTFALAWMQLRHDRVRAALLVLATTLVLLLPVAAWMLVGAHRRALVRRAEETPLLIGPRGSRFDLVLTALWYQGRLDRTMPIRVARAVRDEEKGDVYPLLCVRTARGRPLVAAPVDYLPFRGLHVAAGRRFLRHGEAVLGAEAAASLGLAPGDEILTDRGSLYDLSLAYPLALDVVGVLAPTDGPDDRAVFCDLETGWIAEGIGHSHAEASSVDPSRRLPGSDDDIVLDASVTEAVHLTKGNLETFHFHGDPDSFPISAAAVVPRDAKARTILLGRGRVADDYQVLEPLAVVGEILGFVFRLKRFFDAHTALVFVATMLFFLLVQALSARARRREFESLSRLGAPRGFAARLLLAETVQVLAVAGAFSFLLALATRLLFDPAALLF